VRKAALRFGTSAVELVRHAGARLDVTTLNAKGSWKRAYDTAAPTAFTNALGERVRAEARWEGAALRAKLEGGAAGAVESWRYRRGDVMVVKVAARPPGGGGREAACFWFFERMEALERHVAGARGGRPALLKALAADAKRVQHATQRDTAGLVAALLDPARWASPADEFICPAPAAYAPAAGAAGAGARAPRRGLSPATSPPSLSKSASAASLVGAASPDGRSRLAASSAASGDADAGSSVAGADPARLPPLPGAPAHRRQRLGDAAAAAAARRPAHFRSPSAESLPSSEPSTRAAAAAAAPPPPTGGEALMALKVKEFEEGRGILAVVPVGSPHDTAEPQLLGMSPEQAEDAAARMRELETALLLSRQGGARGVACCGLVLSRERDSLPEHLRVWEMRLD
jgi:hypothetical protein